MDWKTFIVSIIGSGAVTAIVNSFINNRIQIRAIKESGLYSKRAEVLDEMMKRMERLDRLTGELISFFQYTISEKEEVDRRNKTSEALNLFVGFYKRNRHYLPKKLSDEIDNLCKRYKEIFIDFIYVARPQGESPNLDKWQEIVKSYERDFTIRKEEVSGEFRKLIGVK